MLHRAKSRALFLTATFCIQRDPVRAYHMNIFSSWPTSSPPLLSVFTAVQSTLPQILTGLPRMAFESIAVIQPIRHARRSGLRCRQEETHSLTALSSITWYSTVKSRLSPMCSGTKAFEREGSVIFTKRRTTWIFHRIWITLDSTRPWFVKTTSDGPGSTEFTIGRRSISTLHRHFVAHPETGRQFRMDGPSMLYYRNTAVWDGKKCSTGKPGVASGVFSIQVPLHGDGQLRPLNGDVE